MNLPNLKLNRAHRRSSWRGVRAFTMIEIAIAIGIIGFALVAIIGILPAGLNVQKDNREDTAVNQDATFFMEAIRGGAVFTNYPGVGFIPYAPSLNFLTNYVESISVTNRFTGAGTLYTTNGGAGDVYYRDGGGILGLLTTPHFLCYNILSSVPEAYTATNFVRAVVRGINGSALEQNGANSAVAFRYIMEVQITPFLSFPANVTTNDDPNGDPKWRARRQQAQYLAHNLYDVQLTFHWPVLPNGGFGPNHQTFRSVIAGHLNTSTLNGPSTYYAFVPHTYLTNAVQ